MPKIFKIIPQIANWEEVLFLTKPEQWSPASTAEATKIFCSNLNGKMVQRFYNLVLLP
jgi:essential nuclear protein 1